MHGKNLILIRRAFPFHPVTSFFKSDLSASRASIPRLTGYLNTQTKFERIETDAGKKKKTLMKYIAIHRHTQSGAWKISSFSQPVTRDAGGIVPFANEPPLHRDIFLITAINWGLY